MTRCARRPAGGEQSLSKIRISTPNFHDPGSASPELIRGVSESLAGRAELIELAGLDLCEAGAESWRTLWLRGGLPRSYLAASEGDGRAWREGFIRTFPERDIPQLGITIPAAAMRRFRTMPAHWHGQTWNASDPGRSMSLSDKTIRRYPDLLAGTYMARRLQPWFENVARRQVKAPKIHLRDTGLLQALPDVRDDGSRFSRRNAWLPVREIFRTEAFERSLRRLARRYPGPS